VLRLTLIAFPLGLLLLGGCSTSAPHRTAASHITFNPAWRYENRLQGANGNHLQVGHLWTWYEGAGRKPLHVVVTFDVVLLTTTRGAEFSFTFRMADAARFPDIFAVEAVADGRSYAWLARDFNREYGTLPFTRNQRWYIEDASVALGRSQLMRLATAGAASIRIQMRDGDLTLKLTRNELSVLQYFLSQTLPSSIT